MTSPDLTEWVAVKENIFSQYHEVERIKFICGWNENEQKVAIIFHEGTRQASDNLQRNKASLLSVSDLHNINRQLSLIDSTISTHFPIKKPKPDNTFLPGLFASKCAITLNESTLISVEHYLQKAVELFGKKVVLSLIFNDTDIFDDFEENINELKLRSLDKAVAEATKELHEILTLRKRAETLLEMKHLYALEDDVAKSLSVAYSELYNFQLMPFLELRELAHNKLTQAKQRLKEEIGPNIKKQVLAEFDEWNDQYFCAAEALQHLYQDYYRKTYELVLGQRDRMSEDQKRFGKAAFTIHGLPRLQKLEEQIHQEKLKLLHSIKASREYQRDKIKLQLTNIHSNSNAFEEMERIEAEVYEAQNNVLDAHLDVLETEERLYKTQLANLMKEYTDDLEIGIFYEAVEKEEDFDSICDSPAQDSQIRHIKEKLNKLYRKRALVRNKKKALVNEKEEKKHQRELIREKDKMLSAIKRPERKLSLRQLPADKLKEERKKTIQRLKAYKKKATELSVRDNTVPDASAEVETEIFSVPNAHSGSDLTTSTKVTKPEEVKPDHHMGVKQVSSAENLEKVLSPPIVCPPPPPPSFNIPPPPPPPPPTFNIPPPPPPPPPPTFNIAPPHPFPPSGNIAIPPSNLNLTPDMLKNQLANAKKPALKDAKISAAPQPFNLEEILSMRGKLKKPTEKPKSAPAKGSAEDFSALLHSTMRRIKNMTEGSDLDSDEANNSDFD